MKQQRTKSAIKFRKKKSEVDELRGRFFEELNGSSKITHSAHPVQSGSNALTEGPSCSDADSRTESQVSGRPRLAPAIKKSSSNGSPHMRSKKANIARAKEYGVPVGESREPLIGNVRYSAYRVESEKRATAVVRKALYKPFRG